MSTTKQKEAAKKNIEKAREVQSARAHGAQIPKQSPGISTSAKDKLPDNVFAFPKERKEPLTDAKHIRNAITRFDQVEGISDAEKDAAWKRIMKAAKKNDVEVNESSWRELGQSSKTSSSKTSSSKTQTSKTPSSKTPSSKTQGSKTQGSKTQGSKTQGSKTQGSKKKASVKK